MWKKIDITQIIEEECKKDPEFASEWEKSCEEYRLIGEMIALRKESNLSQSQLANLTNMKQQSVSRIEKKEVSPTLKTFCNLLDSMNCSLKIVKNS